MNSTNYALLQVACGNQDKNSPYYIAITGVCNGITQKYRYWMMPDATTFYFGMLNGQNVALSQLHSHPCITDLWQEIHSTLCNYEVIIALNDGYSAHALAESIRHYSLPLSQSIHYVNAKNICRLTISTYSYQWQHLAELYKVSRTLIREGDECDIWAEIIRKTIEANNIANLRQWCEDNRLVVGEITAEGIAKRSHIKRIKVKVNIPPSVDYDGLDPEQFDESNPFFQKLVVFTGKMSTLTRQQAFNLVARIGGYVKDDLTTSVNYLVVGQQDVRVVGESGLSGKQKKAAKFKEKGADIEIISEADFIEIMNL